jgi:hypothetical protein
MWQPQRILYTGTYKDPVQMSIQIQWDGDMDNGVNYLFLGGKNPYPGGRGQKTESRSQNPEDRRKNTIQKPEIGATEVRASEPRRSKGDRETIARKEQREDRSQEPESRSQNKEQKKKATEKTEARRQKLVFCFFLFCFLF